MWVCLCDRRHYIWDFQLLDTRVKCCQVGLREQHKEMRLSLPVSICFPWIHFGIFNTKWRYTLWICSGNLLNLLVQKFLWMIWDQQKVCASLKNSTSDNNMIFALTAGSFAQWTSLRIPRCTGPVSHNAPFVLLEVCARGTFLLWMAHCGLRDWCIAGSAWLVYCWYYCIIWSAVWPERYKFNCQICSYIGNLC